MATPTTTIVEKHTTKLDQHGKKGIVTVFCMVLIQLTILLISAGKFDWFNVRKGLTCHKVNSWEARRMGGWNACSSEIFLGSKRAGFPRPHAW